MNAAGTSSLSNMLRVSEIEDCHLPEHVKRDLFNECDHGMCAWSRLAASSRPDVWSSGFGIAGVLGGAGTAGCRVELFGVGALSLLLLKLPVLVLSEGVLSKCPR